MRHGYQISLGLILITFVVLAFSVLYADYYLLRPHALDFVERSTFDVPFLSFFLSVFCYSMFIMLFGGFVHFLILRFLLTLGKLNIDTLYTIKCIAIAKFAFILPYVVKVIYFTFIHTQYYLDQVIQFTRFSPWKLIGVNSLILEAVAVADIMYCVLFVILISREHSKLMLVLSVGSYLIYFLFYLFFSVLLPLGII